jgi:hypothetical protein
MAPTRSGSVKALASTFESQVFRCAPIRWHSTLSALFHWITAVPPFRSQRRSQIGNLRPFAGRAQ